MKASWRRRCATAEGHSVRVGDLAAQLAREMGLPEETAAEMKTAGLLHDIGKVGISEEILHKSVLTRAEIEVLMTHPLLGLEICKDLRCARPVLSTIKSQHEHQDGSGYPEGLSGEAIPVGARVLGLANTFDVITSRDRLSPREAVELLAAETEQGKWNREVFEALESLYRDGRLESRASGL